MRGLSLAGSARIGFGGGASTLRPAVGDQVGRRDVTAMSGVSQRPYVLLSCAMSVDGYIDDSGPDRLLLSNDADLDRVDGERALADGILVRSAARRSARQERGLPVSPAKVTITGSGNLDPQASFFTAGDAEVCKLVYCASPAVRTAQDRLNKAPATSIIDAGNPLDPVTVVT